MDEFMAKHGLRYEETLYMGDDIPDLEPMVRVGFPVCPADAAQEIVGISRYVSGCNGGRGCVRDVIEQVLRSQGLWFGASRHPEF
jgi:3-deoxy-D-manno-octulosonate 8-phosphate phosphatase (KDO 8-P phosphatase)